MSDVVNQFSGLPIKDLIGGPLMAASAAQLSLAHSTSEFISSVGFKKNDDGSETMRMANFSYADTDGKEVELNVPMLSIVKVPSLAIKTVDISFEMEVKSSSAEKSKTDAEVQAEISGGWGPVKVAIKGSVSTSKENTRSTDTSAKYHIEVHAADDGMSEGLARVLDILNSTIVPVQK